MEHVLNWIESISARILKSEIGIYDKFLPVILIQVY